MNARSGTACPLITKNFKNRKEVARVINKGVRYISYVLAGEQKLSKLEIEMIERAISERREE